MNFIPTVEHLNISKGAAFEHEFGPFLDEDGVAVDLTGATIVAQMRDYTGAVAILAEFTAQIVTPANLNLILSLTATETAALVTTGLMFSEFTRYVYDVKAIWPTTSLRIAHGEARVSPSSTIETVTEGGGAGTTVWDEVLNGGTASGN
jgi:CBS-domain-containing membrane protein